MSSVQERLQLKRTAVDKWTIREQLCLASAVACSGDQNWMSVSRSLKMLCGNNRPSDWFSQKSCAVQYGELLENVETPKRKKRSEKDSTVVETPTESILRKLTQERISELQTLIKKEQEEYAKLREEILFIQNGSPTEAQLKEMAAQIDQEKEQKLIEQQKYMQWLKEREEKKIELQKAWRPGTSSQVIPSPSTSQQAKLLQLNLNIQSEDLETEDSSLSSKPGTSPLLTSLLKSSSPAPSSTTHTTVSTTSSSNVRVTAPTITNLLTGNNSQIQLIATPSTSAQYNSAHNQPLTGPLPTKSHPQSLSTTPSKSAPTLSMLLENKLKDNSAAIQDSSVLNEIKTDTAKVSEEAEMETEEGSNSPSKDEDQQLMEVFNGLIPDNIDELADILTNNNAIILNPELLEEESILENVESLIDDQEEVEDKENQIIGEEDTKTLEKQSQDDTKIVQDFSMLNEYGNIKEETTSDEIDNLGDVEDKSKVDDACEKMDEVEIKQELLNEAKLEEEKSIATQIQTKLEIELIIQENTKDNEIVEEKDEKSQNSEVSDDSSDNTTLQVLKEKIATTTDQKETEEEVQIENKDTKREDITEKVETKTESIIKSNEESGTPVEEKSDISLLEEKENMKNDVIVESTDVCDEHRKSPSESLIIVIQEDDDSIAENLCKKENNDNSMKDSENITEQENEPILAKKIKLDEQISETKEEQATELISKSDTNDIKPEVTTTIVIDTDEDSPMEVVKDEAAPRSKRDYSRKKLDNLTDKKPEELAEESRQNLSIKRLKEREGSESPLVDDDNADSMPRTRRRYSSTPIFDSIPNSPASSDDKEYKAWKKSIMMIYSRLTIHKNASIFLKPVTEDVAPNYKTIVYRPMDLQTIKKNIENGVIRTTAEFQRDVLLMCQNAIMYNQANNNVYNMAKEMWADSVSVIETLLESVRKEASDRTLGSTSIVTKSRGRKSNRLP